MKGLLLLNLGTPDAPTEEAVRVYLSEFLMDPAVISIPWPIRFALVYGVILRNRPKASAHAYSQVWTEEGSPLLKHSKDFTGVVQDFLYPQVKVALGMRYGNPSVESALLKLKEAQVTDLLVAPLYPQFAKATTQSTFDHVDSILKKMKWKPLRVRKLESFCDDPGYISSYVAHVRATQKGFQPDHLLLSFHGLPARQVKKADPLRYCLNVPGCCDTYNGVNKFCYRAQCFETARQMAKGLGLSQDQFTVSFQSRLGGAEWIRPYTDEVLDQLLKKGVKKLAVVCPAFVADCLETLEEIQMRLKTDFISKGGEDFRMVEALNSDTQWARAFVELVGEQFSQP